MNVLMPTLPQPPFLWQGGGMGLLGGLWQHHTRFMTFLTMQRPYISPIFRGDLHLPIVPARATHIRGGRV